MTNKTSKIILFSINLIFCFCANAQFSNTYNHGFSDDHISLIKKHDGNGYVQASTISKSTRDIHLMKTNSSGSVMLDVTFESGSNDEYALDVCPGNNDTYVICGYERVGLLDLGFVMSVDSSFNFLNKVYIQVAANNRHTPALKIINSAFFEKTSSGYWAGDPSGGYLVVGFEAVGYTALQSKTAYALKISDALTIQWARKFNSPISVGVNDWDMCSNANWKWTGPEGYVIGGSGTAPSGEQAAFAARLNLDGTVVWSQLYTDNSTAGSFCVAADGAYDDAETEFYQLVNFSQTQSGGIVAMNENTGVINSARSRYLISPYNDYYTYEFGSTCASSQIFISGYGLNQVSGGTQGIFPFLLRYDKNVPAVDIYGPHFAYPRQSANYNPTGTIFSTFSTVEQPRIYYPKHWASRQLNIWSVAGYEDGGVLSEDHLITPYFDGKDSCDFINPMINPVPVNIFTYPIGDITTTYNLPTSVYSQNPIATNVLTCCPVNADFTYTISGTNCTYNFSAVSGSGSCSNFTIKDISGIVIASGAGSTFSYTFLVNGLFTVCFEDCAIAAGSSCSNETCQTFNITCALPCGPIEADFSFVVNGCDVTVIDNTPEGNPYGCEHWNFGTMPTIISTDSTTFHFFASGDYTICHTECCMDILGTLYYQTVCKTVTIYCAPPCCLPTDFIIAGTGCCYQFTPIFGSGTCPGLSYLWTFDDGTISTASNPYHCYTAGGIYNVTFSAFCGMGPSVTFTKSINVICTPPPPTPPGLGISWGHSGGGITVVASGGGIGGGGGGGGWTPCCTAWYFGDGYSASGPSATHYYSNPGTYEVTCTTTFTPVAGQAVIETVSEFITVNQTTQCMCSPDKVLAFAGSPVSCDAGMHSTWLYVVDNVGEANMDYQWMIATSPGGPFTDLAGANGIQTWVENVPQPSILKCRCTCLTTGALFYTSEISISNGNFIPTITATPATICSGGSSALNISPPGVASVQWSTTVPAGSSPLVSPLVTTNYSAFIQNLAGCGAVASSTVNVNNCSVLVNDSPASATSISYSSNVNYPNCYPIIGDMSGASDSPESAGFTGTDSWYKFVAQSSAVSITLTSATMDDAIELYQKSGTNYILMPGGSENASAGASDFERLNYQGLTPGTTYYVSVGSVSGAGGSFSLCIQHLMSSGCAYTIPATGFSLCGNYKALYRGSATNGVSYGFNFTGTGGGAPAITTTIAGTNGLINLSNPTLALRYGGIYNVTVDVNYALHNSAGSLENIVVAGNSSSANCTGVWMMNHPLIEVKANQRCLATLLRSNYLIGTPVTGSPNVCSATGYTYEFTQVVSCSDATPVSLFPLEYSTPGATPYLPLGVLQMMTGQGAWSVRIRPNFSYGSGIYGPSQLIRVNNTAASAMLPEEMFFDEEEKSLLTTPTASVFPNPFTGEDLHVSLIGLTVDRVGIEMFDETGRMIYNHAYSVQGTFSTTVLFDQPLSAGVYLMRFLMGEEVRTERVVVE